MNQPKYVYEYINRNKGRGLKFRVWLKNIHVLYTNQIDDDYVDEILKNAGFETRNAFLDYYNEKTKGQKDYLRKPKHKGPYDNLQDLSFETLLGEYELACRGGDFNISPKIEEEILHRYRSLKYSLNLLHSYSKNNS